MPGLDVLLRIPHGGALHHVGPSMWNLPDDTASKLAAFERTLDGHARIADLQRFVEALGPPQYSELEAWAVKTAERIVDEGDQTRLESRAFSGLVFPVLERRWLDGSAVAGRWLAHLAHLAAGSRCRRFYASMGHVHGLLRAAWARDSTDPRTAAAVAGSIATQLDWALHELRLGVITPDEDNPAAGVRELLEEVAELRAAMAVAGRSDRFGRLASFAEAHLTLYAEYLSESPNQTWGAFVEGKGLALETRGKGA